MNNQPAFPAPAGVSHITEQGMTLRDYFAAKAMQSWITVTVQRYVHQGQLQIDMPSRDVIAESAYAMADAMLRAREEK